MDPITLMALAGGLGSLISTIKGTSDAARQNKKTEELNRKQLSLAEAERLAAGRNYLDTLEGKTISTQAGEKLRQTAQALNNNAIKSGATNEQRLAQSSSVQDAYNQMMQNLAAQSTANNRYYDNLLRQARDTYNKNQMAINTRKAQSDVNSGIGMANAIGNLASAGIQTYGSKKMLEDANTKNSGAAGTNNVKPTQQPTIKAYVPTSFDFSKITQKDVERANDMFLGSDYLRRYIQYK